jgi:mannose-6-phosphate isomerase-like protein (cupin superfamily)
VTVVPGFPGATAVSRLRVYDWPTADGLRGGSPHLHTASTEGYVVLAGEGSLQTLSGDGYAERPLRPGTVAWFTPGTVHRLVAGPADPAGLDILVVMQNAGLPEAGDAVLTFPPDVLADPAAYARAAAPPRDEAAARIRRDLAIAGFLELREGVRQHGRRALEPLYRAATALVRDRAGRWRELWREGALAEAERTGRHLTDLIEGRGDHLGASTVHEAVPTPAYGMCGHLRTWP